MNKILIAYFSYQGHTRQVAEQIRKAVGGTLFEIKPAQAYSDDYDTCEAQAKKETREGYRPPLAESCTDLASCDTILLGTPNWFNTMAPPVATFLASNDFSDKTIVPFCTNGGGGLGHIERDMKKLGEGATVLDSLEVYEGAVTDAGKQIDAWLSRNGLSRS